MAMTLTGFVYDNAGNAISGATVQGYVSADNATSTAESSTTSDSNGKWAITTSTASRIPMDVKITYGSNTRWLKAGDKLNVTDMTVSGKLTVGEDGTGYDVELFGDTSGRTALWDQSEDALHLNDNTELKFGSLAAGDMVLYHDGTNSYIKNATGALKLATESSGIAVTIGHTTSEVTIGQNLTVTGTLTLGSGAELTEAELEMLDGITAGTAAASKALVLDANKDIGTIRNLTINGTLSDGNYTFDTSGNVSGLGTVASGAITTSGVLDITDATDSSDATGDTGALRTEGGASIAKKLYVGTDLSVGNDLTVAGDLTVSGDTITVDTTNTTVKDSLIELNNGAGSNANDLGIVMERGSTGDNAIIAWDESADVFTVGTTTATGASTGNLSITAAGFTAAAIIGTTIDAATDFTIGDTVITDGVVTDSTGLQLAANLDINGTVDISGDLTLSAGGDGALQFTNAGENSIKIPDAQANALIIEEGDNAYITFVTSDGSEAITVAKATTFSAGIANSGTIAAGTWNGTAIASGYIAADAITGAKIADDAIDSEHYTDGSIDNAHLADDAVDSDELAAGAVDTAHIGDNQITLAKMAGIARGKIIYGDASGDPAALAAGDADQVLTHDGTDISWEDAAGGGGGITLAAQWRVDQSTTSVTEIDPIVNWEVVDTDGYGGIGTAVTYSSGVFTFGATGIWLIEFGMETLQTGSDDLSFSAEIETCTDGSTFDAASRASGQLDNGGVSDTLYQSFMFDVTNTSTHKVQFALRNFGVSCTMVGDSHVSQTYATFTKLGDT